MATNLVIATLNVTFDDKSTTAAEGQLKLEIDDREDGPNGGDTSFQPGDDVYYLMFKDSNITVLEHFSTAGGISSGGTNYTKSVVEYVNFNNSDSSSLGYPPNGSVTLEWLGRCTEITSTGSTRSNSALPVRTKSSLKMAGNKNVAGILKATYTSIGSSYKLTGVPKDFTEVMITVVGQIK